MVISVPAKTTASVPSYLAGGWRIGPAHAGATLPGLRQVCLHALHRVFECERIQFAEVRAFTQGGNCVGISE